MRLTRVDLQASPIGPGRVRLTGDVTYRQAGRPSEQLWFDVPDSLADALSSTGNPWLAALVPLAVTLQEPLELCLPVDPALREGAEALMHVWAAWYPAIGEPVPLECDTAVASPPPRTRRTASFFSAGVDSFHTLLRHEDGGGAIRRVAIDDLLTVWGFDIPLDAPGAFARLSARIAEIAARLHKTPVTIATNLRESGWRTTNWGKLGQGPALAATALALENRLARVLIPASVSYRLLGPWGTHPLVDPLLSTTTTEIRDDGALSRRMAKIEMLAKSDLAMGYLHVCWAGRSELNCGQCEKCLRTMTALELVGALGRAPTFPAGQWSLAALSALRPRQDLDREHLERLGLHARTYGRDDIARAIDASIRRYTWRRRLARVARLLGFRRTPSSGAPASAV